MIKMMSPQQRRRAYLLLASIYAVCVAWFIACGILVGWGGVTVMLAIALVATYSGRDER